MVSVKNKIQEFSRVIQKNHLLSKEKQIYINFQKKVIVNTRI